MSKLAGFQPASSAKFPEDHHQPPPLPPPPPRLDFDGVSNRHSGDCIDDEEEDRISLTNIFIH